MRVAIAVINTERRGIAIIGASGRLEDVASPRYGEKHVFILMLGHSISIPAASPGATCP
jgi:hypothetical protein